MGWGLEYMILGGGFIFIFYFHPENWGRRTQFDEYIFQDGLEKTTNQGSKKGILPNLKSEPWCLCVHLSKVMLSGDLPYGSDEYRIASGLGTGKIGPLGWTDVGVRHPAGVPWLY